MTDANGAIGRSRLERLLRAGQFAVTAELQTTDSADPGSVFELAELLRGKVDAVNCTDNSAAHPHISAVAAARLLIDRDVEPIVQFTCRDRNRLGLQADILGAAALGVRNLCCMTGDDVTAGDHPEAKPIYDLDSLHLLRMVRILRDQGTYLSGRKLTEPPDVFVGAVENPFAPPLDFRPLRMGKKIEAGAEFIQLQLVFNLEVMRVFADRAGELGLLERAFVLPSVYVPRSTRALRYMRDAVPGIDVPETMIERMERTPRDRQEEEGLLIAHEIIQAVRAMPGMRGVHLISIGGDDLVVRLIEEAGLLPRPKLAVEVASA